MHIVLDIQTDRHKKDTQKERHAQDSLTLLT